SLPPHRCWLNLLDINDVGWIIARVTSRAIRDLLSLTASLLEAFQREVSQGICANVVANLVDGLVGGDELLFRRRVDAVITGRDRGRTGNAHVHFLRPSAADHAHNLPAGMPPDDRVIDQPDAFPLQKRAAWIKLQLDPKVRPALVGSMKVRP